MNILQLRRRLLATIADRVIEKFSAKTDNFFNDSNPSGSPSAE
jgi:hypothetical protein